MDLVNRISKIKSLHVMFEMPMDIGRETNRVLKTTNQFISIRFHMNLKKNISDEVVRFWRDVK